MFRTFLVTVSAAALTILAPGALTAQSKTLKLGEEFEGELGGKPVPYNQRTERTPRGFSTGGDVYVARIPITLKAGQEITITAAVTGKERTVGLQLLDPTQKRFGDDAVTVAIKTTTLSVDEVNATGKYTIVVISDRAGPFMLQAVSAEEDREALETRLAQLEKEIKVIKAKLKDLDERPKKP